MDDLEAWLKQAIPRTRAQRFLTPQKLPYAVYFDYYTAWGSDSKNLLRRHDVRLEVYTGTPDDAALAALFAQLDNAGLEYDTTPMWLNSEKMHETIVEFSYIETIGGK